VVLAARTWWWDSLILDVGVRIGDGVLWLLLLLSLLLLLIRWENGDVSGLGASVVGTESPVVVHDC
jgi:hypothetical protein